MPSTTLFFSLLVASSAVYSYALMRLALRPWRLVHDQHWTERARLLWTARIARVWMLISTLAVAAVLRLWLMHAQPSLSLTLLSATGGFLAGQFFCDRIIEPRYTAWRWCAQIGWTIGVISALVGILAWVAWSTPEHMVIKDWLRLATAALLMVLIYSGVWLLALPGRGKNPHTPRLLQIVDDVTTKAGLSPARAWVADSVSGNACALMHIRSIVVTSRAMEALDDGELRTLVQHEMAHLRESVPVRCARLLGGLSWLGFAFTRPVIHRIDHIGVFWILLGVLLVQRFANSVAKRMENRADSLSTTSDDEGPLYARALEKLYEINQIPAVMRKRLLHPDLYDRMTTAGLTPSYPRPAPPERWHWSVLVSVLLPVAMFLAWKMLS